MNTDGSQERLKSFRETSPGSTNRLKMIKTCKQRLPHNMIPPLEMPRIRSEIFNFMD